MSIILDKVKFIYGQGTSFVKEALKDINLVIDEGQFIGLIGHTGSGKSTLIQLLNGLLKPTGGTVYFDGQDICDKRFDLRSLRQQVGLVFQYPEHQLFEETVFKDVCYGPRNLGLSRKECELRAFEALRMVKFEEELFYQSPLELSGGQKRRAAIAGVLAMKPRYLVLDEPAAGLDPRGRDEILGLIKDMHEETGNTVILVSHSMEDVADYADRILVMNRGELAMDGAPKDIFARYTELEKMGLAAPEVTYIMNDLAAAGIDVDTSATTIKEAAGSIIEAYRKRGGYA